MRQWYRIWARAIHAQSSRKRARRWKRHVKCVRFRRTLCSTFSPMWRRSTTSSALSSECHQLLNSYSLFHSYTLFPLVSSTVLSIAMYSIYLQYFSYIFIGYRIPVVATGVLRFLEHMLFVEADEYFRRYQTDPQSFHFVLLDEVKILYSYTLLYICVHINEHCRTLFAHVLMAHAFVGGYGSAYPSRTRSTTSYSALWIQSHWLWREFSSTTLIRVHQ